VLIGFALHHLENFLKKLLHVGHGGILEEREFHVKFMFSPKEPNFCMVLEYRHIFGIAARFLILGEIELVDVDEVESFPSFVPETLLEKVGSPSLEIGYFSRTLGISIEHFKGVVVHVFFIQVSLIHKVKIVTLSL
jgi:hypothetical protein